MKRPINHKPDGLASLPPHDAQLEAAVLGAALLEAPALRKALELLPDEQVFYVQEHRLTWTAVRAVFLSGQQVDMLTVMNQLRADGNLTGAGGPQTLLRVTNKVTSGANVESHARLLTEFYGRRLTIQAARQLLAQADDPQVDLFELYADAHNTLSRLTRSISTKRAATAASLYDETIEQIARACTTAGLTGVPTGWPSLDQLTGGWQPGNLIIVAGRPGMGKTTAALALARQASIVGQKPGAGRAYRTLFVTLEMPARELMMKLIATEVNLTTHQLAHGKLTGGAAEAYDIGASAHQVKTDQLLIDDSGSLTVGQLRARAAELKAQPGGLDMLIIDYLQLVKADTKGYSREEQVAEVSRSLKALAKELEIPVIALAQLNREVEKRHDKRPIIADLRESGQLEQDADMIIFAWRGEYYGIDFYETDDSGSAASTANTILLDFAKNRNGPTGEIILGCDIARGRFWDLAAPTWGWRPDSATVTTDRRPMPKSTFGGAPDDRDPFGPEAITRTTR